MGNNLTPYVFAVGLRCTYFKSTHYKFIENDKIQEGMLLNSSNDSLDPYDYHLSKNGMDCFKKLLEVIRIHNSWPGNDCAFMEEMIEDEEDEEADEEEVVEEVDEVDVNMHELEYTNGSNEVEKIFDQKCVICLERASDYIFKQWGHVFVMYLSGTLSE